MSDPPNPLDCHWRTGEPVDPASPFPVLTLGDYLLAIGTLAEHGAIALEDP